MNKFYSSLSSVITKILTGELTKREVSFTTIISGTNIDLDNENECKMWINHEMHWFKTNLECRFFELFVEGQLYTDDEIKEFKALYEKKWTEQNIEKLVLSLLKELDIYQIRRELGVDNIYLPFSGEVSREQLEKCRDSYDTASAETEREYYGLSRIDWISLFLETH